MTNFSEEKQKKNLPRFASLAETRRTGKAGKERFKINLRIANNFLILLIIVLGVYYVAGANDITVKGFKLQELKVSMMETEDENNKLELKIMSLGSYNNLSERINELEMVAVGQVEYLSSAGSIVAKK